MTEKDINIEVFEKVQQENLPIKIILADKLNPSRDRLRYYETVGKSLSNHILLS